jgi:hypothetical protein
MIWRMLSSSSSSEVEAVHLVAIRRTALAAAVVHVAWGKRKGVGDALCRRRRADNAMLPVRGQTSERLRRCSSLVKPVHVQLVCFT